jgi:poly [ADP-ribose] polymerase
MSRYLYLIKVEGEGSNNNKFYQFDDLENGNFKVTYGRVGAKNPLSEVYPISQWDKKYKEKTSARKGYKDITNLMSQVKKQVGFKDISDPMIADIINFLLSISKNKVSDNYLIKSENVTILQIQEVQKNIIKNGTLVSDINNILKDIYSCLPRKMKNVADYLIKGTVIGVDSTIEDVNTLIAQEQDNLDSMSASVQMNVTSNDMEDVEEKTILDVLGVSIELITKDEENEIKKLLGEIKDKYSRAIKVTHNKSRERFQNHVNQAVNKKCELLFHGSRNENFISILMTGLLIRPVGAVVTGGMFGSCAIYFAPKAKKSLGYTSLNGSYWSKGNANRAYMALFETHLGKSWDIYEHASYCYDLDHKKVSEKGCDSVHAHAGKSLYNDELMIYNTNQSTIKYLIELK